MPETDYDTRYAAINDALWLIQRGPANPNPPPPPTEEELRKAASRSGYTTMLEPGFATYTLSGDVERDRYAEVSLALDVARFLLDEELADDDPEDES